jgi:GNAT superfamily N-acetyltransferase
MHPCVREARESDLDRIRQLIVDLASYERAAQEVKTTNEQLRVALFGPQPAAYALVAENDNKVVGFALYFRNFSTWEGVHGIYLEDLYVMPEYRGSGLGRALLSSWLDLPLNGATQGLSGRFSIGTSQLSTSTAASERSQWRSGPCTD